MNRFNFILLTVILFSLYLLDNNVVLAQSEVSRKAKAVHTDTTSVLFLNDSLPIPNKLQDKTYSSIQCDTSNINVRYADSVKLKSYLKDKDFKYFEDPESTMTLWEKLMAWINKQLAYLTNTNQFGIASDIFMYLLIAIAVIAILFGIFKSEIRGLFFSENKNGLNIHEAVEDIHTIDFDNMIEEAMANQNYRYAVRLNYLRSLKILADKNLINWKIDKTNREFLKEINQKRIKTYFEDITLQFESVWYGGFSIDIAEYNYLYERYLEFNSILESERL